MATTSKTVTYKNSIINASVMTDFYTRLNALRTAGGVSALSIPTFQNNTITAAQVKTDLQSAINSTKSAVSFLSGFTLIYGAPDATAGNIIHAGVFQNAAGTTVARAERNIGDMEAVCRAFYSTNLSGYHSANFSAFHSPNNAIGNSSFWSTNNSSNAVLGNSSFWSTNCTFCGAHGGGYYTANSGFFSPDCSGYCYGFFHSWTHYCPYWYVCDSNHGAWWTTNNTHHACSARHSSNWSANNSTHACAARHSSNFSSFNTSNLISNQANFSSNALSFTVHKNPFKVEGLDMA